MLWAARVDGSKKLQLQTKLPRGSGVPELDDYPDIVFTWCKAAFEGYAFVAFDFSDPYYQQLGAGGATEPFILNFTSSPGSKPFWLQQFLRRECLRSTKMGMVSTTFIHSCYCIMVYDVCGECWRGFGRFGSKKTAFASRCWL